MTLDSRRIYDLLPAVYRTMDSSHSLLALVRVIADLAMVLEEDIKQLYDDQFIETCADWAVPYIGELVDALTLQSDLEGMPGERAVVANTLAYRRRKGTAPMIEQLAHDITGCDALVVEFFSLIAAMQHLSAIRTERKAFVDLRDKAACRDISTPFDRLAHSVDVRRIESERGMYNIPNIGIFLWRLLSCSSTNGPASEAAGLHDGRHFLFHPLGWRTRLFTRPESEEQISHIATRINLPLPLSGDLLDGNWESYYGADKSVHIRIDGADPLSSILGTSSKEGLAIMQGDLSDRSSGGTAEWSEISEDKIVIDPLLGRFTLPAGMASSGSSVEVTYHYASPGYIGGGEYDRSGSFSDLRTVVRVRNKSGVGDTDVSTEDSGAEVGPVAKSIVEALGRRSGSFAVEITDEARYEEAISIVLSSGSKVEIRSANGIRAAVIPKGDGGLLIRGSGNSEFCLSGLLIDGPVTAVGVSMLTISHCTIIPKKPGDEVGSSGGGFAALTLSEGTAAVIEKSIIGSIVCMDGSGVTTKGSIIGAGSAGQQCREDAPAFCGVSEGYGGMLEAINSTIIGRVSAFSINASNCIFLSKAATAAESAPVRAKRQDGCIRFSYLPFWSNAGRRYRSIPSSADDELLMRPVFWSLDPGDPGFCCLAKGCPAEVSEGAEDGGEIGAFHDRLLPIRTRFLKKALTEYLKFGLEAGVFFVGTS
jgi:hypothetical protein